MGGNLPALAFALVIGLVLGTLGSGGAILMLPVLVYVAGIPPQRAIDMSLIIVGGAAALASFLHYRRGNYHAKATLVFGATGLVGAYVGSTFTHRVAEHVLMLIFALVMAVAGAAMLRKRPEPHLGERCHLWRCLMIGLGVGLLTGFLGVGGGFLIIPALIVLANIEPRKAVGASLAVITINCLAGLLGHLRYGAVDVAVALQFLGLASAGMLAGVTVAGRLPEMTLRRGFALMLLCLAAAIGALEFR
ncbi:MAG: sulfite exporter TauE/SafE family protein [Acidobacteriota bacterium]